MIVAASELALLILERDRARAALDELRPVAEALDAWVQSWVDAGDTPDPDDLPEEAALYAAACAVRPLKPIEPKADT